VRTTHSVYLSSYFITLITPGEESKRNSSYTVRQYNVTSTVTASEQAEESLVSIWNALWLHKVRYTEINTAEPLIPEPGVFEVIKC
jgi:hypothetical protein